MAISQTHYQLLKLLRDRGELPRGGHLLEIGEANLYGDFDPREAIGEPGSELNDRVCRGVESKDLFDLARCVYDELIQPESIVSVDAGGSDAAIKHDLNTMQGLPGKYQLAINHGTAEHVFNIANVFRLMHEATAVGGLMIHEAPFTGWVDHGFYCLQPTLFWDLAWVNRYDVVLVALECLAAKEYRLIESREEILRSQQDGELQGGLMLFVAMRKTSPAPFKVPVQGVYAGRLTKEATDAWMTIR